MHFRDREYAVIYKFSADTSFKIEELKADLHGQYKNFAEALTGQLALNTEITVLRGIIFTQLELRAHENEVIIFFDGVDDLEIHEYLMKELFPLEIFLGLAKFIITSQRDQYFKVNRNETEKDKNIFVGNGFSPKEITSLFETTRLNKTDIRRLAETFSYLPLGLHAASMYFSEYLSTSVGEYLDALKDEETRQLIEEQESDYLDGYAGKKDKGKIYKTLRAALSLVIKKMIKKNRIIKKVIFVCAFINRSAITEEILLKIKGVSRIKLNAILSHLKNRSILIENEAGEFFLHQITHTVLRGLLLNNSKSKQKKYGLLALAVFKEFCFTKPILNAAEAKQRTVLSSHLEVLIGHTVVLKFKTEDLRTAYFQAGICFYHLKNYDKSVVFLKTASSIGADMPEQLNYFLANALREKGRLEDKNGGDLTLEAAIRNYELLFLEEKDNVNFWLDYFDACIARLHILNVIRNNKKTAREGYQTEEGIAREVAIGLKRFAEYLLQQEFKDQMALKWLRLGKCYFNISEAFDFSLPELSEAEKYHMKALKSSREDQTAFKCDLFNGLGVVYLYGFKDATKAIPYFEEAISYYKSIYGKSYPCPPQYVHNLRWAYLEFVIRNTDKLEIYQSKIKELYETQFVIARAFYGESHPMTVDYKNGYKTYAEECIEGLKNTSNQLILC